eukprot:1161342-Pelagomonas_calceolata.AAC.9
MAGGRGGRGVDMAKDAGGGWRTEQSWPMLSLSWPNSSAVLLWSIRHIWHDVQVAHPSDETVQLENLSKREWLKKRRWGGRYE